MEFDAANAGKLFEKGSLFLTVLVGTAEGERGEKYSMLLVNGTTPGVECDRNGRKFVLSWEEILRLAIDRGIGEA